MGVDFMVRNMKPSKSSDSRKCSGRSTSIPSDSKEDHKEIIKEEEDPNSSDNVSQERGSENPDPSSSDPGRISFLTVPSNESSRRPSTADVVIEKLKVEKEEEGGLTISGVALGANCHLSLIIFGTFFILAGIVLSYVGFANPSGNVYSGGEEVKVQASSGGAPEGGFQPTENHYQMRIIGPIFLTGGMLMTLMGISLYAISRKISTYDMERRLVLSTAQLEQLENDFSSQSQSHIISSPLHTSAPAQNQVYPVLSLRRGSLWMEPTPVEHPQTPSEALIISDITSTFPYGIRSVSPLLNNNMALSQQASHYSQHDQLHNLQSTMYPSFQSLSAKRLSSPLVNNFYGENEGSNDIATFPNEDCGSSCFPGRVYSAEQSNLQVPKKKSAEKGIKSDYLPQVFEVVEASSDNATVVLSDEIKDDTLDNTHHVSSSTLAVGTVPEIQVTGPSPRNTSATSRTSNILPDATSNDLPRLSRHSIGRADSGYPSQPSTSLTIKPQSPLQDR